MENNNLVKCKCTECDCNTQTIGHPCSNCQDGRHANVGFFELIEMEKKELTPETGYNVCILDEFSKPGEQLGLVSHVDTKDEAIKRKKEIEKKGKTAYIFPYPGE